VIYSRQVNYPYKVEMKRDNCERLPTFLWLSETRDHAKALTEKRAENICFNRKEWPSLRIDSISFGHSSVWWFWMERGAFEGRTCGLKRSELGRTWTVNTLSGERILARISVHLVPGVCARLADQVKGVHVLRKPDRKDRSSHVRLYLSQPMACP